MAGGFFSAMRDCLVLSWKTSPCYTLLRLVCNLAPSLLSLFTALLGKCILDLLTGRFGQEQKMAYLLLFAGGLCLAGILRSAMQKAQIYLQSVHDELISQELALFMMDRAGTVDIEYFDNADYYDKLAACTRDAPMIAQLLWSTLSAISAAFSVLIAFSMLGQLNLLYGIITILAVAPSSLASAKYTKAIYSLSLDQINEERQKGYFQSLLLDKRFALDLRLFNACGMIKQKYQLLWERIFAKRKALNKKRSILTGVLEFLPEIVIAAIGIDIATCVLSGSATVGDYSLFTGMVSQLWAGVYLLSNAVVELYDNQLKIKNVKSIEQYQNHITDNGTEVLNQVKTITFDHVFFSYPGAEAPTLKDVSFHIHQNEKVALVGLNGSGKSTIIKLLLRLYDVTEGAIKINGIDIREYSIQSLRKNFSVYFQDAPSFCFSLRENITIADWDRPVDDQAVNQAILDSGAQNVLESAPEGLDTYISRLFDRHGIELSGGQYQKLALSRTIYRQHTALVLDEPSSNLDPLAEHQLFERLKKLSCGKTVLFTSHRLANVFLADRIVVIEYGRVLESGSHQELLLKGSRYAELFRYQQKHYVE